MSKVYCLFDATQWQNRLENEERISNNTYTTYCGT